MHSNYQKLENGYPKTETEPAEHGKDSDKIGQAITCVNIFLVIILFVSLLDLFKRINNVVCVLTLINDEQARLAALLIYDGSK